MNSLENSSPSVDFAEITVGAAIGVNQQDSTVIAQIGAGVSVVAGGAVRVSSRTHSDMESEATGFAVLSETAVSASIGANIAELQNTASIGVGANVTATDITVESIKQPVRPMSLP